MYNRIRKALRNLQTMGCCVLLSNDINYKIIQTSLILNYTLELCKMYYIYCKNRTYKGTICGYKESDDMQDMYTTDDEGKLTVFFGDLSSKDPERFPPKLENTVISTIYRLNINYTCIKLFGDEVSVARNSCVHDIVQSGECLIRSLKFYYQHIDLFSEIFYKLSKKFEFQPINTDLFKAVAELAIKCLEDSAYKQGYPDIYKNLKSQKYKNYTDNDINRQVSNIIGTTYQLDQEETYTDTSGRLESIDF